MFPEVVLGKFFDKKIGPAITSTLINLVEEGPRVLCGSFFNNFLFSLVSEIDTSFSTIAFGERPGFFSPHYALSAFTPECGISYVIFDTPENPDKSRFEGGVLIWGLDPNRIHAPKFTPPTISSDGWLWYWNPQNSAGLVVALFDDSGKHHNKLVISPYYLCI